MTCNGATPTERPFNSKNAVCARLCFPVMMMKHVEKCIIQATKGLGCNINGHR
ncbi:hypothetical protein SK128_012957 [Halocaridina rubra]|uniref:Uncharacterized protein n=1 Tax=Halocaridina rubra TaxID=373956 RepID=A0AAN8XC05_HALRR